MNAYEKFEEICNQLDYDTIVMGFSYYLSSDELEKYCNYFIQDYDLEGFEEDEDEQ